MGRRVLRVPASPPEFDLGLSVNPSSVSACRNDVNMFSPLFGLPVAVACGVIIFAPGTRVAFLVVIPEAFYVLLMNGLESCNHNKCTRNARLSFVDHTRNCCFSVRLNVLQHFIWGEVSIPMTNPSVSLPFLSHFRGTELHELWT